MTKMFWLQGEGRYCRDAFCSHRVGTISTIIQAVLIYIYIYIYIYI